MSYLKKRSTAVLIAAVVIVFGTLLGVFLSLSRETAKIEAQFYKGVYLKADKYTQTSIQSQLDKRTDAALGLMTEAKKYVFTSDMAQILRQAREALLNADTLPDKYAANIELEKAWKQIYESLTAHADDIPEAVESYVSTLRGAETVIKQSGYNEKVSEFRDKTLSAFPVNILKKLVFADYPEYFGPLE